MYAGWKFSANAFFLAMAYWNWGEKRISSQMYASAMVGGEAYEAKNEEFLPFRAEAASPVGLAERS